MLRTKIWTGKKKKGDQSGPRKANATFPKTKEREQTVASAGTPSVVGGAHKIGREGGKKRDPRAEYSEKEGEPSAART